jgi:ketosteroid isomerase-like protein
MITKKEIIILEDKLYEAMKNRNLEDLEDLLHPDLLFIIPSGQTITKKMDLQTYRDGSLKIIELTPKVEELNIIDDLAVITLQMDLKGNYNNKPFEAKYKYIRFWKKFSDGIKIVGGSGVVI